ncbi:SAF domain-containing protein [Nostocoides sp. HKS02]|uniref:SAF domain-containing protein n=1 Tax=Nostocoides sp. HKS02 TaxID=1813880 RepID=UPI0012B4729A|nr:SAF domain-containing protein [Tetrasphaera sp. HKS02]QGN59072.1 hypothetical protein GKE56_15595 [Tetrasphaera sp. HKS02]
MTALGGALAALRGPGRRRAWRRRMVRRVLAAACASAAVLGVVGALRAPAQGPTVPVLVATRPLAVGESAVDAVRVTRWPVAIAPAAALRSASDVVGRRLTSVVGAGEPLTEQRLSGAGLLDGQPSGSVAVHVALADPGAGAMVRPGDRIDLVSPDGVAARAVLVLRVDQFSGDSSDPLVSASRVASSAAAPSGLIVAAGHDTAETLARTPLDALGRPALTVVLRSR